MNIIIIPKKKIHRTILLASATSLVLSLPCAAAQQARISRAYVDPAGAVHVTFTNGSDQEVRKERAQSGAEQIKIARDRDWVGWLVDYANPDPNRSWEGLAGTLVIWNDGRVVHRFQSEQVFYDWSFVDGGGHVAFHIGPLHGEEHSHCELHESVTGKLLDQWNGDLDNKRNAPEWVHSLTE